MNTDHGALDHDTGATDAGSQEEQAVEHMAQPPTPVGPIDLAPSTSSECNHGLNSPRFISRSHVQSLCYASILGEATKHFSKR